MVDKVLDDKKSKQNNKSRCSRMCEATCLSIRAADVSFLQRRVCDLHRKPHAPENLPFSVRTRPEEQDG